MKEATSLKEGGVTVASRVVVPVYCKRFQFKRSHRWAFGPAAGNQVLDWIVEAAGRSHGDLILGKWIHFRQADCRNLGRRLEHQGFGRYSF